VLFDFERGFDVSAVEARDARVSLSGAKLALEIGSSSDWPGITLRPPERHWDLSAHGAIEVDVHNVGPRRSTLHLRVDNPGADGSKLCNTGHLELAPGERGVLRVDFVVRPEGGHHPFFGMRGLPLGVSLGENGIDPKQVNQLVFFAARPRHGSSFSIDDVRAVGAPILANVPDEFFPYIDELGQYAHADWPGKARTEADLRRAATEESQDLAAHPRPAGWNEYGGWAEGPARRATGYFRAEKHQGRWWLVDPTGRLFFSWGPDCVGAGEHTPITEREHWFSRLPRDDARFAGLFGRGTPRHGHYAHRQVETFSFARANLLRKYGPGHEQRSVDLAGERLSSWGMNSIGSWSDPPYFQGRKIPYVVTVHYGGPVLEGSEGYWQPFRDVFDPDFAVAVRSAMDHQKSLGTPGDPYNIGYFVDNEISWGGPTDLAVWTLASPAKQTAKQVFVGDLRRKYGGIRELNRSWGTAHATWDALLEAREPPDRERARVDLEEFTRKTAEVYFRTVARVVREVAPRNLYLGARFAWIHDAVVRAAAAHVDVLSYNLYRGTLDGWKLPEGVDRPVIVGEFHFGALDRGMFHPGLQQVADQAARAAALVAYMDSALGHPSIVGAHWFQYRSQPTTGRTLDGENFQIGLVDVADAPYTETIAALREVGSRLYSTRSGR
jgi:hypothetical protein